jgi:hypothetical protein
VTTIKLKRSDVPGKLPLPGDLEIGELAANTADGNLFLKKNDGSVETVWGATQADAKYLAKSSNLADIPNKNTARTNLGVYSQTEVEGLITASESQADTKYLAKSSNLADVPNKSTARNNLSVYSRTEVDDLIAAGTAQLGVGQSWQDVTASRDVGTIYTNTTERPIYVSVGAKETGTTTWVLEVDGVQVSEFGVYEFGTGSFSAIVPVGSTYRLYRSSGSTGGIRYWSELR